MDAFDMCQILAGHLGSGELYHEFFSADRLSVGIYVLKVGATDIQTPHTEAEIYYIVSGLATIDVEDESRRIGAGARAGPTPDPAGQATGQSRPAGKRVGHRVDEPGPREAR